MESVVSLVAPPVVGTYRPKATRYVRRVAGGFEYGWCVRAGKVGEKAKYFDRGCCPTINAADDEMRKLSERYVVDGELGPEVE